MPPRCITCAGSSGICRRPASTVRPCADGIRGLVDRGTDSRALLQSLVRDRPVDARRSPSCRSGAWMSAWCRLRGARLVHRRTRLRNLGDDRLSARALRFCSKAGREYGLALSAAARSMRCASRRASVRGRANTGPFTDRFEAGLSRFVDSRRASSSAARRRSRSRPSGGNCDLVTFKVDADRCRRARRRADLARRQSGRLGHLGAYGFRARKSLALGYVPVGLAAADAGFEIEIIGERRKALDGLPADWYYDAASVSARARADLVPQLDLRRPLERDRRAALLSQRSRSAIRSCCWSATRRACCGHFTIPADTAARPCAASRAVAAQRYDRLPLPCLGLQPRGELLRTSSKTQPAGFDRRDFRSTACACSSGAASYSSRFPIPPAARAKLRPADGSHGRLGPR
jgi:hypothetical protein